MDKDVHEMLEKILARQDEILASQTELQVIEAARSAKEIVLIDKVGKHEEAINGNGKLGLKTEVQLMKDQMSRMNWAVGVFVAAVIADIASRILAR